MPKSQLVESTDAMGTFVGLAFESDEVRELNYLESFQQDAYRSLRFAQAFLDMAAEEPNGRVPFGEAADALRIAIIISYARMFTSGVRPRTMMKDIAARAYDEEQLTVHEYVYTLRDKHIAHSVNAFEEYKTTVMVNTDIQPLRAMSFGGIGTHTYALGTSIIEYIKSMCETLIDALSKAADAERERLAPVLAGLTSEQLSLMKPPDGAGLLRQDLGLEVGKARR